MTGWMGSIWRRLRSGDQKGFVVYENCGRKGTGSSDALTQAQPEPSPNTELSLDTQFPPSDNYLAPTYDQLRREAFVRAMETNPYRTLKLKSPDGVRRFRGPYGTMTYEGWTLSDPPPKTTARWN